MVDFVVVCFLYLDGYPSPLSDNQKTTFAQTVAASQSMAMFSRLSQKT